MQMQDPVLLYVILFFLLSVLWMGNDRNQTLKKRVR